MTEFKPVLSSTEVSLRQAIQQEGFQFPILARTCGLEDDYEVADSSQQLPADCLLLLEAQQNLSYAHVKVAGLEDPVEVEEAKGFEYVEEFNQLVGKEFLIPLSFPNKVNIVHKPGKRKRYAVISQVLESPPRYLRVEADVSSCVVPGSDEYTTVSKGAVLEVTNTVSMHDTTFLECNVTGGTTADKRFFSRETMVNFTPVEDTRQYDIASIVTKMLLPKHVKFSDLVMPDDVIIDDDELASQALLMTFGPLEILGKRRRYFIVGWLRSKNKLTSTVSYKRIMIPNSHWDNQNVRLFTFRSTKAKDTFCEKKFQFYTSSPQSFEDKFYMLPTEKAGLTYLRNYEMLTTPLDDDSSEESSDYEKPVKSLAPPIPDRRLKVPGASVEETDGPTPETIQLPIPKVRPDVWQKIRERTRLGFGHIHVELRYFLSTKTRPQEATGDVKKKESPTKQLRKTVHHTTKEHWKPPKAPKPVYAQSTRRKKKFTTSAKPEPPPPPQESDPDDADGASPPTRPPKPKPMQRSSSAPERTSLDFDRSLSKSAAELAADLERDRSQSVSDDIDEESELIEEPTFPQSPPPIDRPLPPIPTQPSNTDNREPDLKYDYPYFRDWTKELQSKKPEYQKVSAVEIQIVERKNQTAKDFCEYSVTQVCTCFAMCAMEDLARVCWEEKVDGAFLASFDLEDLKEKPFCLKDFSITKVKKIILEGWRPVS